MICHFIGTYWLMIFLNNFNDYVCSAVTLNYYFNKDIQNIRIFCHCLTHNMGTIAWSIVLLPTLVFKLVFGIFDYLLTSDNPNGCQRFFDKLFCCCCMFYEKWIDRFNENYFTISYLGSENFWKSTTRFYYLSERYASKTQGMFTIGDLFGFVGKILISFFTLYWSKHIYNKNLEY